MAATYPWTEADGVWRRGLGSMESFYLTLASPEGQPVHWMIGSCISIAYRGNESVNIEESLRQAWKDIRPDFPTIAAIVDPKTREIVVRSDDASTVDSWLQKSFQVHDGINADELFSAFRSQFCITLHFLRDTNQLVIQTPHTLLDGRGTLYLFRALFTKLSKQSQSHVNGDHVNVELKADLNLTRPYDEWLGVSQVPSEKNLQEAQSIFQRVLLQEKPIRLPGVDFASQPRKPVHRDLSLEEESTRAVIEACKRKGFSVTSAWHAALAVTTQVSWLLFGTNRRMISYLDASFLNHLIVTDGQSLQAMQSSAGEEGISYAQFTTIDLRRWFPPSFIPHQHSIATLQTALPFRIDLEKDQTFDNLSQSLNKQYRAPFAFADDFSFLGPYMAMSRQIIESGAAPPSSTPYLSSMGVVDDFLAPRYGDWELDGFWVSSTMMTGDFQMYLWTWRGRMVFSACYNEGFYESERVDAILKRTRDELLHGLALPVP